MHNLNLGREARRDSKRDKYLPSFLVFGVERVEGTPKVTCCVHLLDIVLNKLQFFGWVFSSVLKIQRSIE